MDGMSADTVPLRLFWWKGTPNFGDALSKLIVERLSGRVIEHAGAKSCDMLAVGSLIHVMRKNYRTPRTDGVRPWIWGAGLIRAVLPDFLDNVQIALLRGPVTAAILGVKAKGFGDPGLLTSEFIGELPEREDRIGLVVHHSQLDDPEITKLLAREGALELIDVRGEAKDVSRQIASCAHVISSSLHGLIVADSCGVANTWLEAASLSHLKYHDYAASIGRAMINPLTLNEIPKFLRDLKDDAGLAYSEGIANAREHLHNSFPTSLNVAPVSSLVTARNNENR
jgi:pyruvyltransferase